jgi:signal transduction histidine kinase
VYFCCLDVVERAAGAALSITVREDPGGLAFEIVADREVDAEPSLMRDRVEALGGSLTIRSEAGPRTVWAGFLPLRR